MAKDCLILPPAPADLQVVERMIATALNAGPQHWAWIYFQNAKGLSEYRQGHFDKALHCMQEVIKVSGDPRRSAQAYAVLAMAQHQLHDPPAATNAFAKAVDIERAEFSKINSSYPDPDWNDQLIAKALIQEAKRMLEQKQEAGD